MTNERGTRMPLADLLMRIQYEYESDLLSRAVETMKELDGERPVTVITFVSTANGSTNKFWKLIDKNKGQAK